MAQSLCKIYLHIIFHIKTTSPCILDDDLKRVHAYIGEIINDTKCTTIWVGGVGDHVHVLCLSPKYSWFAWQGGYAALSVSQSVVDKTLAYIKSQREHHKKTSFQDEYRQFLKLYNIEYDEKYVFTD